MNIKKSFPFLYTNKKLSESEIRNTVPCAVASKKKKKKRIGINLTRMGKTCTMKTFKMVFKKIFH